MRKNGSIDWIPKAVLILALSFGLTACAHLDPVKTQIQNGEDVNLNAPFISPGARNQDPSQGKMKGKTIRIKRPLLMVRNLQRSIDFYEDIVGFELYAVEPKYQRDIEGSVGQENFNTPINTRRRIATMNTSDEVRGLTLREIPDVDFDIPNSPYVFTLLLEASDILDLHDRAIAAGGKVNTPSLGQVQATDKSPQIRYMEFSFEDPDGYLLSVYKNFDALAEDEWLEAVELYGVFDDF